MNFIIKTAKDINIIRSVKDTAGKFKLSISIEINMETIISSAAKDAI